MPTFWERVAADSAKLAGATGELTETVQLVLPPDDLKFSLPAVLARGQEGTGAINDRNRSVFDPETHALTSGRLVIAVFNDAALIDAIGRTDFALGWGLILPDNADEVWDYSRIESRGGGLTATLWIRREALTRGPRIGKGARGL